MRPSSRRNIVSSLVSLLFLTIASLALTKDGFAASDVNACRSVLLNYSDIMDAGDPDLSALRASGAKVIHCHHWADTAVPAANSINYYERVQEVTGDTSDFYKFYLVPGGFHAAQGVGATNVEWLDAIVEWVGNGNAPNELIATRIVNGKTVFSRNACPYPSRATYQSSGDLLSSDNFECEDATLPHIAEEK